MAQMTEAWKIFQRLHQKIEAGGGGLRIKFSDIRGPTMVGSDAKEIFEIQPSIKAKNASPRLKFNKCSEKH